MLISGRATTFPARKASRTATERRHLIICRRSPGAFFDPLRCVPRYQVGSDVTCLSITAKESAQMRTSRLDAI
jgi:hypothetical protein